MAGQKWICLFMLLGLQLLSLAVQESSSNMMWNDVQEPVVDPDQYFWEYDTNGDGTVSSSEANETMQQPPLSLPSEKISSLFKRYDSDKDGELNMDEFYYFYYAADFARQQRVKFNEYDPNKDGFVTENEANGRQLQGEFSLPSATVSTLFKRYDSDFNGKLSLEEFNDFYNAVESKHYWFKKEFDRLDEDYNGRLNQKEVSEFVVEIMRKSQETSKSSFRKYDEDKSGYLGLGEFIKLWNSFLG